jgi:hypothetical protein
MLAVTEPGVHRHQRDVLHAAAEDRALLNIAGTSRTPTRARSCCCSRRTTRRSSSRRSACSRRSPRRRCCASWSGPARRARARDAHLQAVPGRLRGAGRRRQPGQPGTAPDPRAAGRRGRQVPGHPRGRPDHAGRGAHGDLRPELAVGAGLLADVEDESRIAASYAQSDQRRASVACPHCAHRQFPDFFKHVNGRRTSAASTCRRRRASAARPAAPAGRRASG